MKIITKTNLIPMSYKTSMFADYYRTELYSNFDNITLEIPLPHETISGVFGDKYRGCVFRLSSRVFFHRSRLKANIFTPRDYTEATYSFDSRAISSVPFTKRLFL